MPNGLPKSFYPSGKFIVPDMIVNAVTGEGIPPDEPIFILRARDKHALHALSKYAAACKEEAHLCGVIQRADEFMRFKEENPDRMQEPDSRM